MNAPALPIKRAKRHHKAEAQAEVNRIFAGLLKGHKTTIGVVHGQMIGMVAKAAFSYRHSRDVAEFVRKYSRRAAK